MWGRREQSERGVEAWRTSPLVVPANAGTHNHRLFLLHTSTTPQNREITRYGSLRSQGRHRDLRHFVEAPRQNALLRMQAIFGFIEHHRLRTVDHLVGDLFATMRR